MNTFGLYISNISQASKFILLAMMAQVLDGLSFILAYSKYGIHNNELLPIPEFFYAHGGLLTVLLVKAAGIIVSSLLLLYIARHNKTWVLAGAISVAYIGLLGVFINLWAYAI